LSPSVSHAPLIWVSLYFITGIIRYMKVFRSHLLLSLSQAQTPSSASNSQPLRLMTERGYSSTPALGAGEWSASRFGHC
jgi:hypothetical protein